jgi:hypothetical protein
VQGPRQPLRRHHRQCLPGPGLAPCERQCAQGSTPRRARPPRDRLLGRHNYLLDRRDRPLGLATCSALTVVITGPSNTASRQAPAGPRLLLGDLGLDRILPVVTRHVVQWPLPSQPLPSQPIGISSAPQGSQLLRHSSLGHSPAVLDRDPGRRPADTVTTDTGSAPVRESPGSESPVRAGLPRDHPLDKGRCDHPGPGPLE